jgi:hypothetical protein
MVQHQHIDQVKVDKVSEDLSEKVNDDGKVIQNSGEHSLNVGEGLVNRSLSRGKILGADLRQSFLLKQIFSYILEKVHTPNSLIWFKISLIWSAVSTVTTTRLLSIWALSASIES